MTVRALFCLDPEVANKNKGYVGTYIFSVKYFLACLLYGGKFLVKSKNNKLSTYVLISFCLVFLVLGPLWDHLSCKKVHNIEVSYYLRLYRDVTYT